VILEHANRGKKSIGIDVGTDKGVELVYRLAATCDVFLTNKLPAVRKKLRIELDDIRAHNQNIIYVAGTGAGERGPEADQGGYDFLSYWCRAASAMGTTPTDAEFLATQPAPGYGDSIGGMTIAGGILGALFHRERTGEALSVDVSLLGVGMWSMSAAIALSLQLDFPWRPGPSGAAGPSNPLVGTYLTQDGRFLALSCLQGFRYWAPACRAVGREDLIDDQRFASHELLSANAAAAREILTEVFASAPLSAWRERLKDFEGQWSVAQDTLEVVEDPQTVANGYVGDTATADGVPFRLVTTPVQFAGSPAPPRRGPEFNEHCDEILAGIGCGADEVTELKVAGVVA
jgi:crotonobetainyl-CoA:carnitine CoA-transferase CaiB-like acyl-CoA transferase